MSLDAKIEGNQPTTDQAGLIFRTRTELYYFLGTESMLNYCVLLQ